MLGIQASWDYDADNQQMAVAFDFPTSVEVESIEWKGATNSNLEYSLR